MTEILAKGKIVETVEITVTRADGTVQNYGIAPGSDASIRERWRFATRTRRLNFEANRVNPAVPTTSIWKVIKFTLTGGN